MNIPPAKIKTIVFNVIMHLMPNINVDNLRLPGGSCAAYMRAFEMPTLSRFQKSTELTKADKWHLESDGTTLQQQKKMAFIVNKMVLGVFDVADGSSATSMKCLKSELKKFTIVSTH